MTYATVWLKDSWFRHRGTILFEDDKKLILDDPISGRTEISKDQIATRNDKPDGGSQ